MLEFSSTTEAAPVRREELFSLDGVVYTIPVKFDTTDSLGYVEALRKYGTDVAVSWALELALGPDGYQTLLSVPHGTISDDQFAVLVNIVTNRILGKEVHIPGPKASEVASMATADLPEPGEDDSRDWPPNLEQPVRATDTPLDPTPGYSPEQNFTPVPIPK
jgi:hypothetical protein